MQDSRTSAHNSSYSAWAAAPPRRARRAGLAAPYHAILAEAALWWTPAAAPHAVGESQQRLLDAAASPHVTVQVLPTGVPQTALTQCGFFIVDWRAPDEAPIVIVETPAIEVTIANAEEVAEFDCLARCRGVWRGSPSRCRTFVVVASSLTVLGVRRWEEGA